MIIRSATEADAPAMLEIYRPYVEETGISFELDVPSLDEFSARVRKYLARWACLVAETEGRILGYAYGSLHRERKAYQWAVETTIYVDRGAQGQGLGRRLYGELIPALRELGYCNAYAGVALPNAASVALHQAVGFVPIGTFPRVGYKFGQWFDVAWFHLTLRQRPSTDPSSASARNPGDDRTI